MDNNCVYVISRLSHARFPSFFFIEYHDVKGDNFRNVISTIQTDSSKVKFTGIKPEEISEFLHAKICLISSARFMEEIDDGKRISLINSEKEYLEVGTLEIISNGQYKLVINNKDESILLLNCDI